MALFDSNRDRVTIGFDGIDVDGDAAFAAKEAQQHLYALYRRHRPVKDALQPLQRSGRDTHGLTHMELMSRQTTNSIDVIDAQAKLLHNLIWHGTRLILEPNHAYDAWGTVDGRHRGGLQITVDKKVAGEKRAALNFTLAAQGHLGEIRIQVKTLFEQGCS